MTLDYDSAKDIYMVWARSERDVDSPCLPAYRLSRCVDGVWHLHSGHHRNEGSVYLASVHPESGAYVDGDLDWESKRSVEKRLKKLAAERGEYPEEIVICSRCREEECICDGL